MSMWESTFLEEWSLNTVLFKGSTSAFLLGRMVRVSGFSGLSTCETMWLTRMKVKLRSIAEQSAVQFRMPVSKRHHRGCQGGTLNTSCLSAKTRARHRRVPQQINVADAELHDCQSCAGVCFMPLQRSSSFELGIHISDVLDSED